MISEIYLTILFFNSDVLLIEDLLRGIRNNKTVVI